MGQVKENLLTKGFSGRIGDEIVFRQVGKRTVFSKRPRKSNVLSPNQQVQRDFFKNAVLFAKTMLLDPAVRIDYENRAAQAGLPSAYVAAMTDYLKAPEINLLATDFYTGAVGSIIWITVLDAFKIQEMTVTLTDANGALIETGVALPEEGRWKYVATQPNALVAGTKVIVTAKDRPGKEARVEKVL
jgi:hypothetical protein